MVEVQNLPPLRIQKTNFTNFASHRKSLTKIIFVETFKVDLATNYMCAGTATQGATRLQFAILNRSRSKTESMKTFNIRTSPPTVETDRYPLREQLCTK